MTVTAAAAVANTFMQTTISAPVVSFISSAIYVYSRDVEHDESGGIITGTFVWTVPGMADTESWFFDLDRFDIQRRAS